LTDFRSGPHYRFKADIAPCPISAGSGLSFDPLAAQ
jgi:hypothetical protein